MTMCDSSGSSSLKPVPARLPSRSPTRRKKFGLKGHGRFGRKVCPTFSEVGSVALWRADERE